MRRSSPVSVASLIVILALMIASFFPAAAAAGTTAAPTVSMRQYGVPTANSQPSYITAGTDGAQWFPEWGANKIARMTTSGEITEYAVPTADSNPDQITTGPDGALWFTENNGNKIGRITTSGEITEYSTPTGSGGANVITTGPDGALWFTDVIDNKIVRMTTSGSMKQYSLPFSLLLPMGITTGPDKALWFTDYGGNRIGRITTSGAVKQYKLPSSNSYPADITNGPDGALWFTEDFGNKIGRITTSGAITEYAIPTPTTHPGAITVGPDGALWFVEITGDNLGRITTSGAITEYGLPNKGSSPRGITVGLDHALWLTELNSNKVIRAQLDPTLPPVTQWKSTAYFAEGYTSEDSQEYICLENPNTSAAAVWITCMQDEGANESQYCTVSPKSRLTLDVNQFAGGNGGFGMRVVSTSPGIIAERPMYFNYQGYSELNWTGGSDVIGATSPARTFYFAEGTCRPDFDPYICVLNPGGTDAKVRITYMKGDGTTKSQDVTIAANSRFAVKVKDTLGEGNDSAHDFSAKIECTNGQMIVAERPMYFNYKGIWTGGSDVIGATSPAKTYYFAEGTTRPGFEPYLCIQNPGSSPANVTITYMMNGDRTEVTDQVTVAARSRATVNPRDKLGTGDPVSHDFSTKVTSDQPIVSERPMYFDYMGGYDYNWTGGSDAMGATSLASTFYFAEGTCRPGFVPYFCIQNPGNTTANVTLTYMKGDGTTATDQVTVMPKSRLTTSPINKLGTGNDAAHDFSTKVTSDRPIVAERPMYFNYNGVWTGGHDVMGFTP